MSEKCFARLMRDKEQNRGYFGATKDRFFFEYRCTNPLTHEKLCGQCFERKTKTWKERGLSKKNPYSEYYGLITEPIPDKFFGSTWFESKVKQVGQPSESDMARAKKAQQEAKKDIVFGIEPVVEPLPQKTEAKKRGRKPKEPPQPISTPSVPVPVSTPSVPVPVSTPSVPVQTKAKSTKERAKPTGVQKEQKVHAIEASPPLTDIEVVKIIVRPFRHNDVDYFRDAKKNKLYASGKDKRPSLYVGRWNPETEMIDHEFPDSDVE
jgi:hypothetical protein